ncbi:hypothetical protein [Ligilactobacillus salivarius]
MKGYTPDLKSVTALTVTPDTKTQSLLLLILRIQL